MMELGRRKIVHHNITAHPTAEWTLQQFREALPGAHPYRFVVHDRDRVFSKELDQAVTAMGVKVLRTPVRAPTANAVCERLVGTVHRECLDFVIPLGERHLKRILVDGGEKRGQNGGGVASFSFEPFPLVRRVRFRTARSGQGRAVVGRGVANP